MTEVTVMDTMMVQGIISLRELLAMRRLSLDIANEADVSVPAGLMRSAGTKAGALLISKICENPFKKISERDSRLVVETCEDCIKSLVLHYKLEYRRDPRQIIRSLLYPRRSASVSKTLNE